MKLSHFFKGGRINNLYNNIEYGKADILIHQRNILTSGLLAGLCIFYLLGLGVQSINVTACFAEHSGAEIAYDYKNKINISSPLEINSSIVKLPKNKNRLILAEKVYNELYYDILPILEGTPMEAMAQSISKMDRRTAGFMVGIAMKESKFGRYAPEKNGRDCFNYWGYRGQENPTWSGYSCFDSPEHAVRVVGARIQEIVDNGAKRPEDMIVWKCGYSCNGHSEESVLKWIEDVGIYYYKIILAEQLVKNN